MRACCVHEELPIRSGSATCVAFDICMAILTVNIYRFFPAGHSHQLFHLFIIFTNLNQLSAISADLKHLRPSLDGECLSTQEEEDEKEKEVED